MNSTKTNLLLIAACLVSFQLYAADKSETVSTFLTLRAENAKGAHLRARLSQIVALVKAKQFSEADRQTVELRKAYEAIFDPQLRQFTFFSQAEYQDFKGGSKAKFEWIDWGYSECLQMQAFIASERRDFPVALAILKKIEAVSPVSAGPAAETGYVLNQMGKPEEGLAAYRRSYALSKQYASQRPYQAPALRGIGFALIDLKKLDEAERAFLQSLEIDQGNKIALSELAYIREQRGLK